MPRQSPARTAALLCIALALTWSPLPGQAAAGAAEGSTPPPTPQAPAPGAERSRARPPLVRGAPVRQPPSSAAVPSPPGESASCESPVGPARRTVRGATAAQGRQIRRGEDWFASGSSVSLPAKVAGDALATAGHLEAHGEVGEDLIAAADRITVSGPIDGSAYLAAGCMRLEGQVHHNVRGVGWRLIVARAAHIDGGATLAGNEVQFDGTAGPYLMIMADHASIDGHVAGDVMVTARSIDVGPHAQIDGALHFGALQPVRIAAGATISGGVHVLPNASGADAELLGATLRAGWWVWLLGWLLVAAVVLGLWPRFTVSVSTAVRRRSLYCLLLGLAVLIGTPLLAVLLLATVLGVPLSLLLMLLYLVLIPFGYLSAATSTGDWLLIGVRALRIPAASGAWRLFALTLVLIALHLLMRVPILGVALNLLMLVVGSGGLLLALSVHRRAPPGALEMATTAIDF